MDVTSPQGRRRLVVGGVVAAAALGLVALVGVASVERGGDVLGGVDPVQAVRDAPRTIAGARLRVGSTVGTTGAIQIQLGQEGTVDLRADRTDLVVTGLGASTVRVVTDGPNVYVRAPAAFDGRPWGRLGTDGGPALPLGQGGAQVGALLRVLESVSSANDRGAETIEGRRVRHLVASISARDLAGVSPLFTQVGVAADTPVDVYLDGEGRPRRIVVSASAGATTVQLAATLGDFGEPAAVVVPSASEVAEITLDDLAPILGR